VFAWLFNIGSPTPGLASAHDRDAADGFNSPSRRLEIPASDLRLA
jgi:hypothetical protein